MQAGASGVVSVAANVVPGRMHGLCELARNGESTAANALNESLQELFAMLAIESNPIPVKQAVHEMGLIPGGIRLPLLPLSSRHVSALRDCLQKLQLLH
jgi:4-hydroxy-tetrahydrodipicolinate synthase